jgi:C-terminal processing protease CtpA/Prc
MRRRGWNAFAVCCLLVAPAAVDAQARASAAAHGAAAYGLALEYYPAGIGDRWTYESTMRGRFTSVVEDTVRLDGLRYARVASTDAEDVTRHLLVRHDGDRAFQRIGAGADALFVDFGVERGGSFRAGSGASAVTVTFTAEHDTLTVLGRRYRDVRVYRSAGAGGSWDTYFARGIGIVGTEFGAAGPRSRLVAAEVGGEAVVAAEAVVVPTGVASLDVSRDQTEALALLAEVWGFVKYHHPAVTGGDVDWDAELFAVVPRVIAAGSAGAARSVLDRWLGGPGDPPPCQPCAELGDDLHLEPEIAWIRDQDRLGPALSRRLAGIHEHRSTGDRQRYVRHAAGIGNPVFDGEDAYVAVLEPDAGHRLLGLVRFWNIIRYWFPYRDLMDEDWSAVLREFIPRIMADDGPEAYALAMLELAGRTQDTHANIPRAAILRPPRGPAQLPVVVRFVEGQAVVTGFSHDELGPGTGLRRGDVITHLDGAPVDSLVGTWARWYPASNQPARLLAVARTLTRGQPGPVRVSGHRAGARFERAVERVPIAQLDARAGATHDLPGETFRWLTEDVAYMKLSSIRAADVPGYLRDARDASVLVVDIRNYPGEFVPFVLAGRLVHEPTPFARFTVGDPRNPGAFRWTPAVALPRIETDRFEGAVVVLVDETSISQSEYTAMALRAGPNTMVVGSTTAGADGNISRIPLPGGLDAIMTGIGVFYPDRTPTQRVGIVPDLVVRPTIQGIREGRDEVLEAGVSHALGREFRM